MGWLVKEVLAYLLGDLLGLATTSLFIQMTLKLAYCSFMSNPRGRPVLFFFFFSSERISVAEKSTRTHPSGGTAKRFQGQKHTEAAGAIVTD